jgi:hypothetical protein
MLTFARSYNNKVPTHINETTQDNAVHHQS